MTDPYEGLPPGQHETNLRLATRMALLHGYLPRRRPTIRRVQDEMLLGVNATKSQRIAQFVREHPKMTKSAKFGFGGLALGALIVGLLRRRNKR